MKDESECRGHDLEISSAVAPRYLAEVGASVVQAGNTITDPTYRSFFPVRSCTCLPREPGPKAPLTVSCERQLPWLEASAPFRVDGSLLVMMADEGPEGGYDVECAAATVGLVCVRTALKKAEVQSGG